MFRKDLAMLTQACVQKIRIFKHTLLVMTSLVFLAYRSLETALELHTPARANPKRGRTDTSFCSVTEPL